MPKRSTANVGNRDRRPISDFTDKSAKRPGGKQSFADRRPAKRVKRVKKQFEYHSSSDEEEEAGEISAAATGANEVVIKKNDVAEPVAEPVEAPAAQAPEVPQVKSILKKTAAPPTIQDEEELDAGEQSLDDEDDEDVEGLDLATDEDDEEDDDLDDDDEFDRSDSESTTQRAKKKRNDPEAFATSISKILGSGLSTTKRAEPILSRSKDAADAAREVADSKLEARAKHKLRDEKRLAKEKGRVRDVLGLQDSGVSTQAILEEEKRLRKTAQRGVVKLFNAVRAAQVKAEEAQAQVKGQVGIDKREEKVNEMTKQGFLDMIAAGGKK